MLTETQKQTAQAIVQIFETGRVRGDYGAVTLLAGDTGHLTYGKAQTTLASGNLALLVGDYCRAEGATFAADLLPFLARVELRDLSLDRDRPFRRLLREAGDDPVMQAVQDAFFDRVYWQPAINSLAFLGGAQPLTAAVVYDSRVHGSWHRMRDRTNAEHGTLAGLGEEAWVSAYIATRRHWLATHGNSLLHKTVYRMDALQALADAGAWTLALPLTVRGVRIDEAALAGTVRVTAEDPDERVLKLTRPMMRGDDVRALQAALKDKRVAVSVDGVFGSETERAVIQFQIEADLTVDGIVGPATWAALRP
ncbi:MAG: peptidoglycan-binding protein [Alphaproteobacteria bacterium]|nr:peptidoglycan-binding protein [Alphaproteobacteria bacterium]MCB9931246.1 chitosanase [Alphaproteobacteria bacterium]